jgi:hypothetical protein
VGELTEPLWSDTVGPAAWIADRLTAFGTSVTSFVPSGFESYARILHPAETPEHGHKLVRWKEVASWSGLPLHPDAQFHSIALPRVPPASPASWAGQGPGQGSLYAPDLGVLAELLRPRTSTPERCWFGLWDGFGWENVHPLVPSHKRSEALPDPVPEWVRNGPRVQLPYRDYFLYAGPVEAAMASLSLADMGQTPNLWWPDDRSWFVASGIDLAWTYVGGAAATIDSLVSDDRIEAIAVDPNDAPCHVEDWLKEMVYDAADELVERGTATITTIRGTVQASFDRPTRCRAGGLRTKTTSEWGGGFGQTPLRSRDPEVIRTSITFQLTNAVLQLVGG